jgi:pantetheine-phosphate adenylyltransferase
LTTAIYPGSFDPITNGHIDIATRASKLFDKVIIGIFATPDKKNLKFSVEERVELAKRAVAHLPNVTVKSYDCLTTEFARKVNANVMVRGLRIRDDFEREFDFAIMNKRLFPELELVCFFASHDYQFLSSSLMKEVTSMGGNIHNLVPDHVAEALKKKGPKLQ